MDNNSFNLLLNSVREMDAIVDGAPPSRVHAWPAPDVRGIRERVGLSQQQFATLIGVSKRTLENWEQGRRQPTGPARALLRIVGAEPELAMRALHR